MIIRRVLAGAAAVVTLAGIGLGTAASANASVVNGPTSNIIAEAGFQVSGTVPVNEVRTNVTVAPGSTSDAAVVLETNTNGGNEYVTGLRNESGEYFLAAAVAHGVTNPVTGAPAMSGLTWHNVPTINSPTGALFPSATGGTFTIELHYSTHLHTVVVVAGQTENNVASLDTFTGVHATFTAPAVEGVNTAPAGARTDLFFNRNGLTEPAGSNVGGIAGTRVTLDFFNLDQTQGVAGSHVNLGASALPATSSDFNVTRSGALTIIAPVNHCATVGCGTQEDLNNRLISVVNGNVITRVHPVGTQDEFVWTHPSSATSNAQIKVAEYAPDGVLSGRYLSVSAGNVVLQAAANDNAAQQWIPTEVTGGFTWSPVGSPALILTSEGTGVMRVHALDSPLNNGQVFNFVSVS
jgi:hypothetical protein